MIADLTCDARQFKSERIEKKVRNYKDKHTQARGIIYQNSGYDLTPLLSGKIKYAKMKKEHNMDQIRKECEQRQLIFDRNTNWTSLIALIKKEKTDKKYFTLKTDYNIFKWNETYFTADI